NYTGNFVLWPFPNRVRDKRYTYQGQMYSLEDVQRPGNDAALVHGLVFDRPWQYTQPVIGPDAVSVTTYVDVNNESPYYTGYPFDSRLSLTYTLSGTELTVTYEVHNKSSRALPFGFALHPYFSTFADKHDVFISIPAQAVMEADVTHVVIFTPEQVPYICIEYQTCSTDAINLHHQSPALREAAHLLEVQPGATYSGALRYTVVFTA